MGGGLIQLIARGKENSYLTKDPQITFFKIIYRRHTNFAQEDIPQYFVNKPEFGKKTYCKIPLEAGDLIDDMWLYFVLPAIKINDNRQIRTQVAWSKHIGYNLINKVEIEINGKIIDRHYGEWMYIWNELVFPKEKRLQMLVGNVDELTSYSDIKEKFTIRVPLQFWFCKNHSLALPLIALQSSDVKVHLELNDLQKCLKTSPTHYIECQEMLVSFNKYEYMEQMTKDKYTAGLYIDFDVRTRRLYYVSLTRNKFVEGDLIVGKDTGFECKPVKKSFIYPAVRPKNVQILDSYLLINFIFLDNEERVVFSKEKHDYLIETIYYTSTIPVANINQNVNISVDHPCKFVVWGTTLQNLEDQYNYTDRYGGGGPLIRETTLLVNDKEVVSNRDAKYFDHVQTYQHYRTEPPKGLMFYSFSLYPLDFQPSGTLNTSQIDTMKVRLRMAPNINSNNPAIFRAYCVCNNILRVSNGVGGVLFAN